VLTFLYIFNIVHFEMGSKLKMNIFITTIKCPFMYHNSISLHNAYSYMCAGPVYTPDQHTNNINKGLYKQQQIHTACTIYYNIEQILLYQ